MSLLSRIVQLLKPLTQSRLPTRQLIGMYRRVCYWLPELEEETALLVAARLYLQAHRSTKPIKLVTIVLAHQLGTLGYCGVALNQMKRHDEALPPDPISKLVRWVMQMEFLVLSAELRLAPPPLISDLLIQSKAAIRRDVERTMQQGLTSPRLRSRYDVLIQRFLHSATYQRELHTIGLARDQVQGDGDPSRE